MYYTTWGYVRGHCGHIHLSERTADDCLERDRRGCRSQGGYSDREVRAAMERGDLYTYDAQRGPGVAI